MRTPLPCQVYPAIQFSVHELFMMAPGHRRRHSLTALTHIHMYRIRPAIRAVVAFAAFPALAFAQQSGSISGTVSSPTGSIQGARVALDARGNAVAIADAAGKYSMRELPAGTYQLLVTSIGFKPVRQSVTVTAGSNTTADVRMEVGSLVLPGVVSTANRLPMDATRIAATVNSLEPEQ